VTLNPPERVVENYGGRAHAVQVLRGQSKLAAWRDRIVTIAYGREQVLMAPQHLTMDSRGRLIISDPMAHAVHVLDGASSFRIAAGGRRHLTKPAGVAVDAHDNLYVVDSERGLVEVYSPSGVFLRNIGQLDDETLFIRPAGIAIDRERERMYLLDEPRNLMLILDLGGHILKRIGRRNSDETPVEFRNPTEVATGNGAVVVLDRAGTRVQVFDLEGRLLRQFSTHIVSAVETVMQSGMGLSIDSEGNIYLSNVQRSEVTIFDSEGRMLNTFGKMGAKEVQFRSPSGLWVQDTRLFVADTDNRRIAVFEILTQPQQKQEVVLAAAP
jgi:sugar lactone lactonase YvrE